MILTYIKWRDTTSESEEWIDVDQLERLIPSTVHTVGFLVDEAVDFITIAQSIAVHNSKDAKSAVCSRWTIPIENIIERKEFPKYEIEV